MGGFSPCSLHQSLALSFLLIPALFRAAFSASPPLCSETGLWLSSSQGTHVAGPHSHRSDHSSPWLPYGYPLSPPCYSTRESRDRGSLCCFILIIFTLSIFCLQVSCTLFFLPVILELLLLRLPKTFLEPPNVLQPQSIRVTDAADLHCWE